MIRRGKKLINALLKILGGYQLIHQRDIAIYKQNSFHTVTFHKEDYIHISKYKELIEELENIFREMILKDFPPTDLRRTTLYSKLLGTHLSEAVYIIFYLRQATVLKGDICEFGIAQGATSTLIANEIRETDKKIWLYDSFKGLPKPTDKDLLKDDMFNLGSMDVYEGMMACKQDLVRERLSDIDFQMNRVKIIPGFIEETIHQKDNCPTQVCFAYVDFDFYQPILTALQFLDSVLQMNGVIVVDDYDFFSTGAKTAVEEFLATNSLKYQFSLPIQAAGHFCILKKIA